MHRSVIWLLCLLTLCASPTEGARGKLIWADEFEGSEIDLSHWTHAIGDGCESGHCGWGNNEAQTYTEENVKVVNGTLVLELMNTYDESYNVIGYTSGRVHTENKFTTTFGRIEARIRAPGQRGTWPAFWMLPEGLEYGTWPLSGEIDIMELFNLAEREYTPVSGTIHYGNKWPENVYSEGNVNQGSHISDDFHIFAVEWNPDSLIWYLDDEPFHSETNWWTAGTAKGGREKEPSAPFDQPFYILLNLAVGGHAGIPQPDQYPCRMEVDYVRVYEIQERSNPYFGKPLCVPGVVEAEHYNLGKAMVAFMDVDDTNSGGAYRPGGVDIREYNEGPQRGSVGSYAITDTQDGEWVAYNINAVTGTYQLEVHLSGNGPGQMRIVRGSCISGAILATVNVRGDTNGHRVLDNFPTFKLRGGPHLIKVCFNSPDVELDALDFVLVDGTCSSGQCSAQACSNGIASEPFSPFGPHLLPALIQAEHYDYGGQGRGYYTLDPLREEGELVELRGIDAVKKLENFNEPSTDGGHIQGMVPGESLTFTIRSPRAAKYDIKAALAPFEVGTIKHYFTLNSTTGCDLSSGSRRVPSKGTIDLFVEGWGAFNSWQPSTIDEVRLPAGITKLTFCPLSENFYVNYFNISISESSAVPRDRRDWVRYTKNIEEGAELRADLISPSGGGGFGNEKKSSNGWIWGIAVAFAVVLLLAVLRCCSKESNERETTVRRQGSSSSMVEGGSRAGASVSGSGVASIYDNVREANPSIAPSQAGGASSKSGSRSQSRSHQGRTKIKPAVAGVSAAAGAGAGMWRNQTGSSASATGNGTLYTSGLKGTAKASGSLSSQTQTSRASGSQSNQSRQSSLGTKGLRGIPAAMPPYGAGAGGGANYMGRQHVSDHNAGIPPEEGEQLGKPSPEEMARYLSEISGNPDRSRNAALEADSDYAADDDDDDYEEGDVGDMGLPDLVPNFPPSRGQRAETDEISALTSNTVWQTGGRPNPSYNRYR
ncbi:unnamed protein product [Chrysoparadoxa australica]